MSCTLLFKERRKINAFDSTGCALEAPINDVTVKPYGFEDLRALVGLER